MTKTIFEEMGGTYRQVGDYLLPNITVPAEEEIEPIGLWGKRHARHLKEHYKVLYMNLLTSGKLHSYLAEVDKQAEDMFLRLVKEYADRQDVTEQLKKDNILQQTSDKEIPSIKEDTQKLKTLLSNIKGEIHDIKKTILPCSIKGLQH